MPGNPWARDTFFGWMNLTTRGVVNVKEYDELRGVVRPMFDNARRDTDIYERSTTAR